MAYTEVFNPLSGEHSKGGFDYVGTADPFITAGANGVKTIRWQSTPGGNLFDLTMNDAGALVITPVGSNSGTAMGLLLALTYP